MYILNFEHHRYTVPAWRSKFSSRLNRTRYRFCESVEGGDGRPVGDEAYRRRDPLPRVTPPRSDLPPLQKRI